MSALPSPLEFKGALPPCSPSGSRAQPFAGRQAEGKELAALMRAAQSGDAAAYARLVRKIMPLLQRVLWARLRFLQAADRDDLTQEVLLSLHRAMATYDPRREFVPWLMAIARNKMADRARRVARRAANEIPVENLSDIRADEPAAPYPDGYGDPEALKQAIGRLSARQRTAIELVKIRELTSKEAARVLGTSPVALRVSVHRAISALRDSLAEPKATLPSVREQADREVSAAAVRSAPRRDGGRHATRQRTKRLELRAAAGPAGQSPSIN